MAFEDSNKFLDLVTQKIELSHCDWFKRMHNFHDQQKNKTWNMDIFYKHGDS